MTCLKTTISSPVYAINPASIVIDSLPKRKPTKRFRSSGVSKPFAAMSETLNKALLSMSLDDDEPINLPDDPRFKVFEKNSLSILGRLLNPMFQPMSRLIEEMPSIWRMEGKVRGIALSREKFQFVFQREEDLMRVLNDRPWSYKHWTMLLERWTANPGPDFLTSFEVWIRIRNIPLEYYTGETMHELAKAVGPVREVVYDPERSQKTDFIRARVLFDISKPARNEKTLNLPSGGTAVITYEYERIRKKCFQCFRITHEKNQCPFRKAPSKPLEISPVANIPSSSVAVEPTGTITVPRLSTPPGFPPLFPELSEEEHQMALLYISHADPTERMARIQRVKMAIGNQRNEDGVGLPLFSVDMNKGKGMVFTYAEGSNRLARISTGSSLLAARVTPPVQDLASDSETVSDFSSSATLPSKNTSAFCFGSSGKKLDTGITGSLKRSRNRPPAWKRRSQPPPAVPAAPSTSEPPAVSTSTNIKRKADQDEGPSVKKTNITNEVSVASDLRPLQK